MRYAFVPLVTLLVTCCLVYVLLAVSRRTRLFLNPDGMPLVGGIAVGISCVAYVLLSFFHRSLSSPANTAIIASGLLMLASGIWDDVRELSVTGKVITQCIAAFMLAACGVRTHIMFLNDWQNFAVTVVWLLTVTNAFNLLDIMDGLCSSVTIISGAGLLAICFLTGDTHNALFLLVIIGATAAFLFFNMPPARAYLGNAGSHFLGFVLAAISITIDYATPSRQVSLVAPLLIMGFPLYDLFFVSGMRVKNGKSALMKSKDHLALRFVMLGNSRRAALRYMAGSSAMFVAGGIIAGSMSNAAGLIVISLVGLFCVVLTVNMSNVSIDG